MSRKMSHKRTLPLLAVGLLALLAFALRSASLEAQSLWRDEVDAYCYAIELGDALSIALAPDTPSLDPTLSTYAARHCPPSPFALPADVPDSALARLRAVVSATVGRAGFNGPLYHLLLRAWVALAGSSPYALRWLSLAFGVLCVPLTYVLGRRWIGPLAALVAALLVAVSPYIVWYAQEVKMYSLLPALVLLALYALLRASADRPAPHPQPGLGWWAVVVGATSAALYTHILAALLIPVEAVVFLLRRPRRGRTWAGGAASLALLTLPYLPLLVWQAGLVFRPRETGFAHYTLGQMVQVLLVAWSSGFTGGNKAGGTIVGGALALVGLALLLFRCRRWPVALALLAWTGLPLAALAIVSTWQPLFTDRYLIWAAPALYLAIGASLEGLRGRWRILTGAGLAVLLLGFGANLYVQATTPIRADLRAAAATVALRYRPGDTILFQIPHLRYTFDYYFRQDTYTYVEGMYTNYPDGAGGYSVTEAHVDQQMRSDLQGRPVVWLVESEAAMWDARGLVRAWLETHAQQTEHAQFMRVDVRRYVVGEE